MPDRGERATEREFARLKREITKLYSKAGKDVSAKAMDFLKGHKARDEKYRQMVKDGKMKKEDYQAWLRGQVFQGEQWKAKVRQMQQTLYNADTAAMETVNRSRYKVFADNANYMSRKIANDTDMNASFNLYDVGSVQRLAREKPDLLPPRQKIGKDKAYRWYNHNMVNAIQQGIVQGESVQDIALRIGKSTGESSATSILRNARTGFTGATNAARWEAMMEMWEQGVNVNKQWLSTPDSKTRDTHSELNGTILTPPEPFVTSTGAELMYPGDPSAPPEEVWNCRCTIMEYYPDEEGE